MPITDSAKKALRSAGRKRIFNVRRVSTLKDVIKKFKTLVVEKKIDEAKKILPEVYQAIDKASKRGIIKDNTANRKKSRLSLLLKKNS